MADSYDDYLNDTGDDQGGGAVATVGDDSYAEYLRQKRQDELARQRDVERRRQTPAAPPTTPSGALNVPAPSPGILDRLRSQFSETVQSAARGLTGQTDPQSFEDFVSRTHESPASFGEALDHPLQALTGLARMGVNFGASMLTGAVNHPVDTAVDIGKAAATAPYRAVHAVGGLETAGLNKLGVQTPVEGNFGESLKEGAGAALDLAFFTEPAIGGASKIAGMGANAMYDAAAGEVRFGSALERAQNEAMAARQRKAGATAAGQGAPAAPLALPPGQYDLPAGDFSTREQPETDPMRLLPSRSVTTAVPTETDVRPTAPLGMPAVDWQTPLDATKAAAAAASDARQQTLGLPRALLAPTADEAVGGERAAEVSAFNQQMRASPQDVDTYRSMRDQGMGTPGRELGSPQFLPGETYDEYAQRVGNRKDTLDAASERAAIDADNASPADIEASARANGQFSSAYTKGGTSRPISQFPQLTDDALHAHMADLIDNKLGTQRGSLQKSYGARLNAAEAELESRGHSTEDIWTSGLENGRSMNRAAEPPPDRAGFTAGAPLGMIVGAGTGAAVGALAAPQGHKGEGAVAGAIGALGLVAIGARLARDGGAAADGVVRAMPAASAEEARAAVGNSELARRTRADLEEQRQARGGGWNGGERRTGAAGDQPDPTVSAAVRDRDTGKIYKGQIHILAAEDAKAAGSAGNLDYGYITKSGKWTAGNDYEDLSEGGGSGLKNRTGAIGEQPAAASEDVGTGKTFPERLYSRSQRAIEQAPFKKGTGEQWAAALTKNVGQDERAALQPFLDANKGKVLTKAEVLQEHAATRIKLGEKSYGGGDGEYDNGADPEGAAIHAEETGTNPPAKFGSYTEPGGTNYREHVLTLEGSSHEDILAKARELHEKDKKAGAYGGAGDFTELSPTSQKNYYEAAAQRLGKDTYNSSHWPEVENPLVHVRLSDRKLPSGEKALHVEEIQSDWHQQGRKNGYGEPPKSDLSETEKQEYHGLNQRRLTPSRSEPLSTEETARYDALRERLRVDRPAKGVPDAPFKKSSEWAELGLKKVIDEAVRGDYDRVTLTNGAQQARRYDLSKQIDQLHYDPETEKLSAMKNGLLIHEGKYDAKALPDVIGKDAAEKLLATPRNPPGALDKAYTEQNAAVRDLDRARADFDNANVGDDVLLDAQRRVSRANAAIADGKRARGGHTLSGVDLKVGGEGMKGFYDKMLPNVIKDYGKKLGVPLETEAVDLGSGRPLEAEEVSTHADEIRNERGGGARSKQVAAVLDHVADVIDNGETTDWRTIISDLRDSSNDFKPAAITEAESRLKDLESAGANSRAALDHNDVLEIANRLGDSRVGAALHDVGSFMKDQHFNGEPTGWRDTVEGLDDQKIHEPATIREVNAILERAEEKKVAPESVEKNLSFKVTPELRAKVLKEGQRIGAVDPKLIKTLGLAALGGGVGATIGDTPEERKRNAILGLLGGAAGGVALSREAKVLSAGEKAELGAKATMEAERPPASARAAGDAITSTFAPGTRGAEAGATARTLRANRGQIERETAIAQATLDKVAGDLNKSPIAKKLGFVDAIEGGAAQKDPARQPVANSIRRMLDTERTKITALGTGKLENFIEDYFPHLWQDPAAATNWLGKLMGKTPFEGSKAFLKQRKIPTVLEGMFPQGVPANLDAMTNAEVIAENTRQGGLVPVTFNPVEATMLKLREMKKYRMAQQVIADLDSRGLLHDLGSTGKVPPGYARIGDWAFTNKAAPEPVARVLNNYFSPGIRGRNAAFDAYMAVGNTLNQAQLGLSAFHAGMTTIEAMVSHNALTLEKLFQGKPGEALRRFATSGAGILSPLENIKRGDALMKAYTLNGPIGAVADGVAEAGGRVRMEGFNESTRMFNNAREAKQYGRMAKHFLPALLENTTGLVMNELVPRQKLGVFHDLFQSELEKLGPQASQDAVRAAAQSAWDSVDNRLGSLVYDNLFWSKTAKDVLHASVRSVGWNWGTFRELGGGTKDLAGMMKDLVSGKNPELSHRAAYALALPMTTGLLGAITQYLYTGKGPTSMWDLYHPQTGTKDSDGNPNRVVLPTYMKDVFAYSAHPVRTLTNKMNPLLSMTADALANKNFYNDEIYDTPDFSSGFVKGLVSSAKAAGQVGAFAAKESLPFVLQNISEGQKRGESIADIAPSMIGVTPASREATRTKAQNLMHDILARRQPELSPEEAHGAQVRGELKAMVKTHGAAAAMSELRARVADGTLTQRQVQNILKDDQTPGIVKRFKSLAYPDAQKVFDHATPSEQRQWKAILDDKRARYGR